MSCVVGVATQDGVWIGGDSAISTAYETRVASMDKVFIVHTTARESFLIGCVGSIRMMQLLRYSLDITTPRGDKDPLAYLVTVFVEQVRTLLKDSGVALVSNNQESGGFFLVGYEGGLYRVCSDYQVSTFADGCDAIGCGDEYALGALFATTGQSPQERINMALGAAAFWSGRVSMPFRVLYLPKE